MAQIATTIEQSKKLIELGLDADTADMYWEYDSFQGFHRLELFEDGFSKTLNKDDIPAWSLSALMELFDDKVGIAKEYETWFAYDNGKSHCSKHFNNPLDAAFEMVCYLLENKLI